MVLLTPSANESPITIGAAATEICWNKQTDRQKLLKKNILVYAPCLHPCAIDKKLLFKCQTLQFYLFVFVCQQQTFVSRTCMLLTRIVKTFEPFTNIAPKGGF